MLTNVSLGYSADNPTFGPDLARDWNVVEVLGKKPVEGIKVTLEIGPDGALTGNGGCNSFTGRMSKTGKTVHVSQVAATSRYCIGPIMAQESKLFRHLEQVDTVRIDKDGLLMMTTEGTPVVKARPVKRP